MTSLSDTKPPLLIFDRQACKPSSSSRPLTLPLPLQPSKPPTLPLSLPLPRPLLRPAAVEAARLKKGEFVLATFREAKLLDTVHPDGL